MNDLDDEIARVNLLRMHLEDRHGVRVERLERLDRGVFDASLNDGRRWVVRVFSARRPIAQVEGDAAFLRFLEGHDFPAERCADPRPVSSAGGWGVLVTEFVEGGPADARPPTLRAFGALLGRLAALPVAEGPVARAAGALHHYAPAGGEPRAELAAAASWLAAIEDRVPARSRGPYASLRERLAAADDGRDLPAALIHPDPVPKNLLAAPGGDLVLIDWTGAGRGPRLASLAILVWAGALGPGGWSPDRVDAVVAGYRAHVRLDEDELARLAGVMRIRPLVFACRRCRHAVLAGRPPDSREWWWPSDELADAIAARARAAFRG